MIEVLVALVVLCVAFTAIAGFAVALMLLLAIPLLMLGLAIAFVSWGFQLVKGVIDER